MITIEAKRLSGVDRGKQASFTMQDPERHYSGKLVYIEHTITYETRVKLLKDGRTFGATLNADHHITIEGSRHAD